MASPAKALTEEQRQQIISKLLAERRRKGGGQSLASEDDEERTKRVQQLLASRAAARQYVHGALYSKAACNPDSLLLLTGSLGRCRWTGTKATVSGWSSSS